VEGQDGEEKRATVMASMIPLNGSFAVIDDNARMQVS
jgi:hypothetical protein